jgi:hypothetical protein
MQFFFVPNFGHLATRGWNSIGFFGLGGEKNEPNPHLGENKV